MLEFVNSGLYFVQDENNFINPLLQADPLKGVMDPDTEPAGQKSTDPDPHPCIYQSYLGPDNVPHLVLEGEQVVPDLLRGPQRKYH